MAKEQPPSNHSHAASSGNFQFQWTNRMGTSLAFVKPCSQRDPDAATQPPAPFSGGSSWGILMTYSTHSYSGQWRDLHLLFHSGQMHLHLLLLHSKNSSLHVLVSHGEDRNSSLQPLHRELCSSKRHPITVQRRTSVLRIGLETRGRRKPRWEQGKSTSHLDEAVQRQTSCH